MKVTADMEGMRGLGTGKLGVAVRTGKSGVALQTGKSGVALGVYAGSVSSWLSDTSEK